MTVVAGIGAPLAGLEAGVEAGVEVAMAVGMERACRCRVAPPVSPCMGHLQTAHSSAPAAMRTTADWHRNFLRWQWHTAAGLRPTMGVTAGLNPVSGQPSNSGHRACHNFQI